MSSFCLGCGNGMAEGERFCGVCGRDALAASTGRAVDPAVAFGLPPETSGKAIFSLVSGVLFIILPFSLAAVIFGHLSLSEIRNSGGRLTGKGLAIAGLVLGYLGVAGTLGLILWSGFYVRQREKSVAQKVKVVNYENPVVAAVRSLNMAEIAYQQGHREAGYTCSLSELKAAWGLSNDLAHGQQNGYIFELKGCAAVKANGPIAKYQVVAYPAAANKTGTAAFCSNESDLIKVARNGSPQDCLRAGVDLSEAEINRPQNWSKTASR
ncbi:MAG: DUF4190 domain-containing protein [Candidatus Sulfotelmatobacter sp.]